MHVLVVVGTRPEVVKMAPVAQALKRREAFRVTVLATGQHRELLHQTAEALELPVHEDLAIMEEEQPLAQVTSRAMSAFAQVLRRVEPDITLVQGDTCSALACALAAYYERVPVGHVEAGLRTGDRFRPFPEEINRRLISHVADLHFAPTLGAKQALLKEGISEPDVIITGNTVVDALLAVASGDRAPSKQVQRVLEECADDQIVLAEVHRRESIGAPIAAVCRALGKIAAARESVRVVFSVHPNPPVKATVEEVLSAAPRVILLEPPDYISFVHLLRNCYLVVTDSGGIQEEAPTFAKPVLVAREKTERPEGVAAGVAVLVGTDEEAIVRQVLRLVDDRAAYQAMQAARNPYGDGRAAERIAEFILYRFGLAANPPGPFAPT